MIEWMRNVFRYSPLEKELLSQQSEPELFRRYKRFLNINGIDLCVVVAPSCNAHKLPPIPPIVMIHGLGGSMQSFQYIAKMLNGACDIVLIDLPGHGMSPDPSNNAKVFDSESIVEILTLVIEQTCDPALPFILMGQSYGTSHALRISTGRLRERCIALICVTPPYRHTISRVEKFVCKYIPSLLFESVFRARDRQGGLHSPSVNRMVGPYAGDSPRKDQLQINLASRSNTVLLTIAGSRFYDLNDEETVPSCPILIITASEDKMCPPIKGESLYRDLLKRGNDNAKLIEIGNAGHAVLLERPEVVHGIVATFLHEEIDERLSPSWQLSYLASLDNKWSLKNEKKWRETSPVGEDVGSQHLFKGMKVLREGDDTHGPAVFEKLHPEISAIIDISREAPPYDPSTLKRVKYFKFPTLSKVTPSKKEVTGFIDLVNQIREVIADGQMIGVHCHYGFNRTGFLICSYLIEERKYPAEDALKAYKLSRPPGIRHLHFVSEVHVRYSL